MIKSFEIHKFRKFDHIKFDNLGRINIFLGNNNVGKTTVLEAIYAYVAGVSINSLIRHSILRNNKSPNNVYEFIEKILTSFHKQDKVPFTFSFAAEHGDGTIDKVTHLLYPARVFSNLKPELKDEIASLYESKNMRMLYDLQTSVGHWILKADFNGRLIADNVGIKFPFSDVSSDGFVEGRFVDILDHRDQQENAMIFSYLQRQNLLGEFVQEISKCFPTIVNIEAVPYPDGSSVQINLQTKDGQTLPLYNFGDGVQRWYNLVGGLIGKNNSIHCFEEVDATIHPEAQKQLASNLVYYATKYNNQIFMTSHSLEFVDNLLDTIYGSDSPPVADQIRIITPWHNPQKNIVQTRVLTGQEAYESREKFQLELR